MFSRPVVVAFLGPLSGRGCHFLFSLPGVGGGIISLGQGSVWAVSSWAILGPR